LTIFAGAVADPQERRYEAEYDPMPLFKNSDARYAIGLARYALTAFEAVPARSREAFLSLLLFSPR
jgi:hypothetical protein